ncbi:MAG: HD domain-containing phosphohydrolase [Syntrophobacterales bacterium]|jgi:response regulator RpfG family c-di-GMP phosphodiesterase/HAMP domain-containing protein
MKIDRTFLRSKVAKRIFLLFITCALLPVTILAILSFQHVTGQLREQSQERLQQAAGAMGMHLFERLLFLETGMEIVASSLNTESEDSLRKPVAAISGRLQERLKSLGVITKAAKPKSLLGTVQNPPPLTTEQELHLQKGKTLISAKARSGRPAVILMRRLLDPDQPSKGTLVAEVKITYLWRGADENPLPPMTQLWVLDQGGAVLFSTLPESRPFSEQQKREMTRAHSGPFHWRYDERDGVGTYSSLYMQNEFLVDKWIIALGEFKAHVLAPMSKFKKIFPLVVLLSLWVVLLLSINQIRRNLIPLERLQEGTKRIAGRDFDTRVTVTSGDEFQELAESFNAMATRLGKQFNALTTMNEIDRSILSALDTRLIVDTVLNRMRELFPCDFVGVALLDSESSDAGLMHVQYGESESENWLVPINLTAAELQAFHDHPEQLFVDSNKEFPHYLNSLAELEAELFLALPMFVAEKLSGLIVLGYLDPNQANEEDAVQARQLADQVAVAISNARLIEELDELNWGTLYALARAIDAKSNWTAGHSERVTELALRIGQAMGLNQKQLDDLHRGGLLHDLGKIGIPPEVLDKAGKLNDEEYQLMREHVRIGARILEPIEAYAGIIPVVLHHHEYYDGSGYPDGLSGDDIDLGARIFTVADHYDALISDRPYREGLPRETVIGFIKEDSGTKFDPKVVEAFLEVMVQEERETVSN